MKVSMLVVASVLAIGSTGISWADSPTTDATFCKAIGLESAQQPACTQDMMNALNATDKDTVAARWVLSSPLAVDSPNSLNKPPVDDNKLNGNPGTIYKDKVKGVPNEVSAQIQRAMKMNNLPF
jgi:hypothetical protein